MNTEHISPDDPRLTAYALNEMAPAERAEFEQCLAQDAAARQTIAEISATAAILSSALEHESLEPVPMPVAKHDTYAKVIRFPYWTISSLAAACFAVCFIYWQRHELLPEAKQYREVALSAPVEAPANAPVAALPAEAPSEPAVVALEPAVRKQSDETVRTGIAEISRQNAAREQAVADRNLTFSAKTQAVAASVPATLQAQSTPPAPGASGGRLDAADEKIVLSPFEVTAPVSSGYSAASTLAGSRVRTELRDIGSTRVSFGMEKKWSDSGNPPRAELEANTEAYAFRKDNGFLRVAENPLSTFSVDVDTASYANVRRFLTQGKRPPADAVRVEELVNYFPYDYQPPAGKAPFAAHLEVAAAPWAPTHRLVRIGLKGREISEATRPASNLVFLLDVSGSMSQPNKLPLVKQSLRLLVERLRPDDRVAIAVYAGASGLALPSTSAAHKAEIMDAIDRLRADGSTNGAMGIQLAYDIAKANFIPGGVNRVILATDGDFNVGVTNEGGLVRLIEEKAESGVFLTILGFGMGNLKDGTLEQLADKGNGNYAYIDSLAEAKKTLVEQAGATLVTIAKDVKIQVEFNPREVQAYRLIGYENRLLAKEDFNNDAVDAGEVGAGHAVTALYEVVPVGVELPATGRIDALKYQRVLLDAGREARGAGPGELLTVKVRYKDPAGDVSSMLEFTLRDTGVAFAGASPDFKFAAAVAAFGMVLRDSPDRGATTYGEVLAWARAGLGSDAGGYRNEFIGLVERAQQMGL